MRDDPHPSIQFSRPLFRALVAAGLLTTLAGGCALTDGGNKAADAEPTLQIKPSPLVARGAEGSDGRYALGKYYFYQGRLEKAEKAFLDAVRQNPDNVEALNGLGAVYDRMGRFDAAVSAYRAALAKAPQSPHILANLGYSLKLAGRSDEALVPLRQALAMDPGNVVTESHLAAVVVAETAAGTVSPAPDTVVTSAAQAMPAVALPLLVSPVQQSLETPKSELVDQAPVGLIANIVRAAPAVGSSGSNPHAGAVSVQTASPALQVAPRRAAGPDPVEVAVLPLRSGGSSQAFVSEPVPMPARAAATATVPIPSGLAARIEVSNGNGVTGMARAMGTELRQDGLKVTRITNARPFDKVHTVIVFSRQFEGQAMALARALPTAPTLVAGDVGHRGVDLRVVLGADAALALRSPEGGRQRLAVLHAP